MPQSCIVEHDWFVALLTFGLCCGLVISYLPQHYRIISNKSSEGFSPWFLLLGCTSCASGLINMITLQWGIIRCCSVFSFGSCLEVTAGVIQVGLQWFMFNFIMVLFIIYYPQHLRYVSVQLDTHDTRSPVGKAPIRTSEWQLSVMLARFTLFHVIFIAAGTVYILATASEPSHSADSVHRWANFHGLVSATLAAMQYAPQIFHTYRAKVVGALSIPMMCIQTPGAILMVLSIALRQGTNWTSWITFAVAGIMQGILLVMCIIWKVRQGRLGLDDFGNSLYVPRSESQRTFPGLVFEDEDPVAVQRALANALESAAEADVRSGGVQVVPEMPVSEETPLLKPVTSKKNGWFGRG